MNYLIVGYWLRGEAARQHLSVSKAQVHAKLNQEERLHYPTAASFRRLEAASRQTIADLEFAVEKQMLSTALLGQFTRRQAKGSSEAAAVADFNRSMRSVWTARTSCEPGYVVRGCKQYHATAIAMAAK